MMCLLVKEEIIGISELDGGTRGERNRGEEWWDLENLKQMEKERDDEGGKLS